MKSRSRLTLRDVVNHMQYGFSVLRKEMQGEFKKVYAKFDQIDAEFIKVHKKFDNIDDQFAKGHKRIDDLTDEVRKEATACDTFKTQIYRMEEKHLDERVTVLEKKSRSNYHLINPAVRCV